MKYKYKRFTQDDVKVIGVGGGGGEIALTLANLVKTCYNSTQPE
jgi:hypothetical protein